MIAGLVSSLLRSRSTDLRDASRVEQILARCRFIVAIGAFLSAYFGYPELLPRLSLIQVFWFAYISYAFTVGAAAEFRSLVRVRAALHAVDLASVAALSSFTDRPDATFFVFFTYVLLAAGWRWGFVETLITGFAISVIFAARTFLIGVSGCLLLATLLVAVIAETEKRIRDEKTLIANALSKARADIGVTQSVQDILDEIRTFYQASRTVLVIEELETARIFIADRTSRSDSERLTFAEIETARKAIDLYASGADTWRCRWNQGRGQFVSHGIDVFGNTVASTTEPPQSFADAFPCRSFLTTIVSFGDELVGRLYILDPKRDAGNVQELLFLQRMIRPVNSALYNVYLWRRLRAKVGEVERARIARELHDGVIQSLIGLEMQLEVLKRESNGRTASKDIARVQDLLKVEIQNTRALMNEMRPLSVCPDDMVPFMAEMVDRFSSEASLDAKFISGAHDVSLPPQVCRELVQILQEALTNVRKHSQARNVVVRFDSSEKSWQLSIEDDGRGFDFDGSMTQDELDALHTGPAVIKERVRLIQGSLEIESHPGKGSRLKINLLKHTYA